MRTHIDSRSIQQLLQRHRRIVAACLAGLATLLALSVIRAPQQAPLTTSPVAGSTGPGGGEVAVPLVLKDQAVASIASPGDLIDVIAVPRSTIGSTEGSTHIVAHRARVIEGAEPGTGFMPLASGLLVVAVDEATALALAEAVATSDLSIAVHP